MINWHSVDEVREYHRKYRKEHPEIFRKSQKKYYLSHKDYYLNYCKEYQLKHSVKHGEKYIKSRKTIQKRYRDKYFFSNLRQKVFFRDNYSCVKCSMTMSMHIEKYGKELSIDHINGKGRYSHLPDNRMLNLQTLCLSCHGKKDNRYS